MNNRNNVKFVITYHYLVHFKIQQSCIIFLNLKLHPFFVYFVFHKSFFWLGLILLI